jgi:hypothetical protein
MFSLPDEDSHPTKFADWLELSALCSPSGRVGISELVSGTDLEENEEAEDWSDDDIRQDDMVSSTQSEIADRRTYIGEDYPFEMDEYGRHFSFTGTVTPVGAVYLFSLFLSHAQDRTIIPEDWAPKLDNHARNLFQVCSTVAAGGYVRGVARSFGWPRPDHTAFLEALKATYKVFGDGVPVDKPRPAAPKWIKDGGIDIVAWLRSIDGLAGTHYLIAQVASGENWKEKSVRQDAEILHNYWFTQRPASGYECAMFMPFCLEPELGDEEGVTQQERLADHMKLLTIEFGTVFYRYRLAHYASAGLRLTQGGHVGIEGVGELQHIVDWVKQYRSELCARAAAN